MSEPRKVNSNVEKYKALGKRFGGAEGRKQDQEALVKESESPSEITNVITGPITDKIEKIDAKPVDDSVFEAKPVEEKKP